MSQTMSVAVVIVAAGSGARAQKGGDDRPKQYRPLAGVPVLARSIAAFTGLDAVRWVVPVIGAGQSDFFAALELANAKLLPPVAGGSERQASVLAGLCALRDKGPDLVLIHDAARPLLPHDVIERIIAALDTYAAALPVIGVSDTIKRSSDGKITHGTENRAELWAAQTPQGFRFGEILDAHQRAARSGQSFTDDAAIAEWAGMVVQMIPGDRRNLKLTTGDDFALAEWLLGKETQMETRTGTGLDIHRFVPGDSVRLGEVDIPHTARLDGHSDADAALHVLTDALLGALAEGDIGTHFPPSEAKWKGEPSRTFLAFAAERVTARGGRIVHLDLTLMCEAPKIGPVAPQIRANIAAICGIDLSRVSVKATTAERLGFVGRGEGLLAHGIASVELPRED